MVFVNLWGGAPRREYEPGALGSAFPPTLLVHGTQDEAIPYGNATRLYERLSAEGITAQLFTTESAGHTPVGHRLKTIAQIDAFLAWLGERA